MMLSASEFQALLDACVFFSYDNGYITKNQAHDLICSLDTERKFTRLYMDWVGKESRKAYQEHLESLSKGAQHGA